MSKIVRLKIKTTFIRVYEGNAFLNAFSFLVRKAARSLDFAQFQIPWWQTFPASQLSVSVSCLSSGGTSPECLHCFLRCLIPRLQVTEHALHGPHSVSSNQ